MTEHSKAPIYELSVNARVSWQAHSLSTAGNNGSNRLLPRRQLLADSTETDAISGNISKHRHAALAAEYFAADGCPLCPACRVGDGRRAAALLDVYVWPMITEYRQGTQKVLARVPLPVSTQ